MKLVRSLPASRAGFTFLEIMLVVAIIGIMLALVGPRLVGKSRSAKIVATKQQMNAIKTALGNYELVVGQFPTSEQGLEALVTRPSDVSEEEWEKCMDEVPRDSWKQKFIYRFPGESGRDYDIISMGSDKKESTDDDISNAPKESSEDF